MAVSLSALGRLVVRAWSRYALGRITLTPAKRFLLLDSLLLLVVLRNYVAGLLPCKFLF